MNRPANRLAHHMEAWGSTGSCRPICSDRRHEMMLRERAKSCGARFPRLSLADGKSFDKDDDEGCRSFLRELIIGNFGRHYGRSGWIGIGV